MSIHRFRESWRRLMRERARTRALHHLGRFVNLHPCEDAQDAAVQRAAAIVAALMAERYRMDLRDLGMDPAP